MSKGQDGKEVYYPQPGLEVVPVQQIDQVWAYYSPALGHAQPRNSSPHPSPQYPPISTESDKEALTPAFQGQSPFRSKRLTWFAVVLVVLIIIGAVLGGVLGTTLHPSKKKAANPSSTTKPTPVVTSSATLSATPSATAKPDGIRAKSPLSVTGWERGNQYSIRVAFQSDENMIQYTAFESDINKWQQTSNITKAKAGTPIALTSFDRKWYGWEGGSDSQQVEMFFINAKGQLNEWSWDSNETTTGHSGSLSPYTIATGSDSHLASYWPFILYQDAGLNIHEIVYDCSYPACWSNRTLNVTGYDGTNIGFIPESQNMATMNLIVQRDDQGLMSLARDSTKGTFKTASAFSISLPPASSFAALSVLRPSSSNTALNTYILYQDTDGVIQVVWKDDNSGWKGPSTFPAFEDADNGTSIACMTQSSWFQGAPLQVDSPLSRCYFQSKSALREVRLDGTDWKVVGNVDVVP